MEIYNEEVRDLLGKELNKNLEVKERADIGVYVKDLSGYVVHNADDLENIMKLGNKNREYLSIGFPLASSQLLTILWENYMIFKDKGYVESLVEVQVPLLQLLPLIGKIFWNLEIFVQFQENCI